MRLGRPARRLWLDPKSALQESGVMQLAQSFAVQDFMLLEGQHIVLRSNAVVLTLNLCIKSIVFKAYPLVFKPSDCCMHAFAFRRSARPTGPTREHRVVLPKLNFVNRFFKSQVLAFYLLQSLHLH